MVDIFWWVIFPYVTLSIMIVGCLYRYMYRQKTWTAPSTEFLEKKWLRIGSPLFHYGILLAIIGHAMGLIIPLSFYQAIGVSDDIYHFGAVYGGGLAGLMVISGAIILLIRKATIDKVRIHATFADFFSVIAIIIVAGIGTYMTIIYNTTVEHYEYRTTIGPWFRSIFALQPNYQLMSDVPLLFKVHVIASFGLFASIPFTHLVHIYSAPLHYLVRSPQQYRSRVGYSTKNKS
jgi:nitrate reductase gamma subunit